MMFHQRARTRLATIVAGALTIGLLTLVPQAANAAPQNLVVNGDFGSGVEGWKSNRPDTQPLSTTTSGHSGAGARLTTASRGTIVLNDAKDTVASTAAGVTYTITAWVKSARAGATSQIKAREVGKSSTYTHQARIRLDDTNWHKITHTFTTRGAGAKLDVNVLFWGTTAGQSVYVDDVSLVQAATTPAPQPTTPAPQPTTPAPQPSEPTVGTCTRPAPTGTQFGSSISTSGQSAGEALAGVDAIFGTIPIVRVFDPGMVMSWDKPRTQMLAGRDLVISFRPSPQDVLSGKYDAEFAEWFAKAPSDVTIYWSYIHEPEPLIDQGSFTADQYRRAWQRIDSIADAACRPNMYATLTLTGWTTTDASKRDWRDYYAGGDVIDVMAFDPYNGASNPTAVTGYPSAASMYDSVVRVAREAGKPYGLAETGSPKVPADATGSQRAAWLKDVAAYNRANGALFVTYFHSSRDGEWRLLDGPSQSAWRTAVASSD